jgi:hypothetical protein
MTNQPLENPIFIAYNPSRPSYFMIGPFFQSSRFLVICYCCCYRYKSGQLKENIEKVMVTEELTALANGQQIEFVVKISEEQYKKVCQDLIAQHKGKHICCI